MVIIGRIRNSTFIRHNAIFFAGSVGIGALNYLYYPVLGRLLQPVAFGEIQALVSMFLQISIFLTVLGMLSVNIVANYEDERKRDQTILELEKLALLISVLLLGTTVLAGSALQRFFHFEQALPFSMLALAICATVPFIFRSSYLRGRQLFGLTSAAGLIGAGAKLIFSVILVLWGLGTNGAMLGIVLAQLLAFGYAALYARKHGFSEHLRGHLVRLPDYKLIMPELKYASLVLTGSLTITIMYSIDIVVVKHYFDAHTAGLYAGISTVARILFFLTASIAQVLMPAVKLHQTARQNRQILIKSLLLLVSIGGAALAVFWFFPNSVITHLMGKTYLPYAYLLPRLSLVIFVVSILNLLITHYLALRRYGIAAVVLVGAAATYLLVLAHHQTVGMVVDSLLWGSASMAGALGIWAAWEKFAISQKKGGMQ